MLKPQLLPKDLLASAQKVESDGILTAVATEIEKSRKANSINSGGMIFSDGTGLTSTQWVINNGLTYTVGTVT